MDFVRIGVVGAGLVGKRHMDVIAASSALELGGIVEPDEAGADLAFKHNTTLFSSLDAMLSDGSVDGVVIATPTSLHVTQALSCVKAGCAVLVEKPIGVEASEAERLVHAANEAGVPLLVGHHRRYNPSIQRAHDVISSGEIGDVRAVQATCWFYKPDHYFDVAPWRKQKGAGPISVNLVHDVDLIRHLVGEIVSVQAQAAPSLRGFANEDVAAAVLRFANGAVGTITVSDSIAAPWSWEHTSKEHPIYPATTENCYLIGGSNGSLSVPDLRLWRHEGPEQDWWTPISATPQIFDPSEPLFNQLHHFADVIKGKAAPLVSGEEGLKTLRVVEAIQQSAASGETISLA
ncbi:MAG: Gfo/Idh/MocA family oxidoreductase [Pseudomonadota bacterium]